MVSQIVQMWNHGKGVEASQRFAALIPHTKKLFGLLDAIALQAANTHQAAASASGIRASMPSRFTNGNADRSQVQSPHPLASRHHSVSNRGDKVPTNGHN